MSGNPFCPCDDYSCKFNPVNHNEGCNLCVEDCVKTREIPTCFFQAVNKDVRNLKEWSFEAFADFVNANNSAVQK